jgi:hypothetical protein
MTKSHSCRSSSRGQKRKLSNTQRRSDKGQTASGRRPSFSSSSMSLSATPARKNSHASNNESPDVTPPKANGVDGFMFSSPVKSSKKPLAQPINEGKPHESGTRLKRLRFSCGFS